MSRRPPPRPPSHNEGTGPMFATIKGGMAHPADAQHPWLAFLRCDLRRRVEDASDEATDPHERRLDVSLG
jgi:hypothetical protein